MNGLRRSWLLQRLRSAAGLALAANGLPLAAAASPPADAAGAGGGGAAPAVQRGRVLRFPRDHGAHLDAGIEWWYLTGVVQAVASAGLWGFQITFFRARTGVAQGLPGRLAPRHLLFAHAALTSVPAQRHWHADRVARWNGEGQGQDQGQAYAFASLETTQIQIGPWLLRREGDAGDRLQLAAEDAGPAAGEGAFGMALRLQRQQPLLLQGEGGFSRKGPQEAQASHYYSEPQLAVQGSLVAAGKTFKVSGRAWADHEWSDELLHPQAQGWDWIGINLADGSALTAFQLRRADGSALWAGGSWRQAGQSSVRNFGAQELRWRALRWWRSPASGARYPVAWHIDCPAGSFEVQALLDAQELDSRRSTGTIYWEGVSELRSPGGQRLGLGYLEMTGYAAPLRL